MEMTLTYFYQILLNYTYVSYFSDLAGFSVDVSLVEITPSLPRESPSPSKLTKIVKNNNIVKFQSLNSQSILINYQTPQLEEMLHNSTFKMLF